MNKFFYYLSIFHIEHLIAVLISKHFFYVNYRYLLLILHQEDYLNLSQKGNITFVLLKYYVIKNTI